MGESIEKVKVGNNRLHKNNEEIVETDQNEQGKQMSNSNITFQNNAHINNEGKDVAKFEGTTFENGVRQPCCAGKGKCLIF